MSERNTGWGWKLLDVFFLESDCNRSIALDVFIYLDIHIRIHVDMYLVEVCLYNKGHEFF